MIRFSRVLTMMLALSAVLWWGCNKKSDSGDDNSGETSESDDDDDDDDDNDTSEITGTLAVSSNVFAEAYPEGLSIGSFPEEVTTPDDITGALAVDTGTTLALQAPGPNPPPQDGSKPPGVSHNKKPLDKLEYNKEVIDGTAAECFSEDVVRSLTYSEKSGDACYGFDYGIISGSEMGSADLGQINNHIGAIKDDQDQSLAKVSAHMKNLSGLVPPTAPAPCMVAKGREVIASASSRVEGALGVVGGMLCQAKKNAIAEKLPEVGESLDLTSVFSTQTHFTVSAASIERKADVDGRAVYHSKVAMVVSGGPAGGNVSLNVIHSPSNEGNETYSGVLWVQEDGTLSNNKPSWNLLGISYEKIGTTPDDTRTKFQIHKANYAQSITEPLVSPEGVLNMNPGADANGSFGPGQANDYMGAIEFWNFDINPYTYQGNIAYWINPGGNFGEKARGFLYNTKQNADGTLVGCAHTGAFSTSIRQATRDGSAINPEGCYTPQLTRSICGTPGDNQGPQIIKQCYVQAADGSYSIDTAKTTGAGGGTGFDILNSKPTDLPEFD